MLVSFIVPTIGRDFLKTSISSLLQQSDPDWEAIVVGDGLDQKAKDFVESLCGDPRITTIYAQKVGQMGIGPDDNGEYIQGHGGMVRNIGLEQALGEWIGFLDDDDILDVRYVEWLRQMYNHDIVIFRMLLDGGDVVPPGHYFIDIHNDGKETEIIEKCRVGISCAIKRKLIRDNNISFINDHGEDFDFISKCMQYGDTTLSSKLAYYVRPKPIYL